MITFVSAVLVVLVASFLCSIFESVLLSLTRPQVEVMVRDGKRAGRLLAGFKDNMDRPIAAILILNTAAHTIGAAVAGASYTEVFGTGTLWAFSLVFTLAVLLFTEIIPKTLGVTYAATIAAPVAYGIDVLTRILKPMVVLSEKISRSLRGKDKGSVTSAEEIRLLAMLGSNEGAVGTRTAGMIVGAAQLSKLQAHDVMLPRDEVVFLSATMTRDEVLNVLRESGHSRFPWSPTDDLDDASHVVLSKDLLHWMLSNEGDAINWEAITNEVLIVPETTPLIKLLRTYQDSHRHLAVVVDEYGTIEGIATLEDVLEEIVGDIQDESDTTVTDVHQRKDGTLLFRGNVDLRRVCAELGIAWQPEHEATTVGGMVTEVLQRIPMRGDFIDWHGHRIEVVQSGRRRVRRVAISRLPETDLDQDD